MADNNVSEIYMQRAKLHIWWDRERTGWKCVWSVAFVAHQVEFGRRWPARQHAPLWPLERTSEGPAVHCLSPDNDWALNVYPYLCPGLCELYAKTAQKALLWVNRDVERELTWDVDHLLHLDDLSSSITSSSDDLSPFVLHVYCYASSFARGFWYPSLALGFQATAHQIFAQQQGSIFYIKFLCSCVAILDAAPHLLPDQCLVVFTSNMNTVQLFNSLSALPAFNWMLILVAHSVLSWGINLWVFHVPGVHNEIMRLLICYLPCRMTSLLLCTLSCHLDLSTHPSYTGGS